MVVDPARNMNMQSLTDDGGEFLTCWGCRMENGIEIAGWFMNENIIVIIEFRIIKLGRLNVDIEKIFQSRQADVRPDGATSDTLNEHLTRGPHDEVTPIDSDRIHRPLDLVVVGVVSFEVVVFIQVFELIVPFVHAPKTDIAHRVRALNLNDTH